jgi:hypothetical protein
MLLPVARLLLLLLLLLLLQLQAAEGAALLGSSHSGAEGGLGILGAAGVGQLQQA